MTKIFLLTIGLLFAGQALADGWDALRQPGAIAIMRHALAPGTGDPARFDVDDCATQRNLDDRGRAQARAIGDALRERDIAFDAVLTSQWCRCRDTARLLDIGAVRAAPALNSFFGDFSTRDVQTRDTLALIDATPGRIMLVTHQVNISALTGRGTRSGQILVIRRTGDGVEVLGDITIAP
ncbi:MAG: histidine phosphatase family protein [Rhodobacteraceae bacterium]|nr:histidine phosphatase family protein [Paracoccaceae bacterium]